MSTEPRIVSVAGGRFPKALVTTLDPGTGIALVNFLDANGKPVDSGNSVIRFAPVAPLAKAKPTDDTTYPAVLDTTLAAAIKNPPAATLAPVNPTPVDALEVRVAALEAKVVK